MNIKLHNTKYIKNKKFEANGVEAKSLKIKIIFEKYMKYSVYGLFELR